VAQVTIVFGALLTLLGVGSYFLSGMVSVTALIPAFFGLPVLVLGWVMRDPARTKHAAHGAALLALIGLAGSARGVGPFVSLLTGGDVERPSAAIAQTLMAFACVVFLVLAIKSFRDARKAQVAEA
jgi:uncharacterized membrane protein